MNSVWLAFLFFATDPFPFILTYRFPFILQSSHGLQNVFIIFFLDLKNFFRDFIYSQIIHFTYVPFSNIIHTGKNQKCENLHSTSTLLPGNSFFFSPLSGSTVRKKEAV